MIELDLLGHSSFAINLMYQWLFLNSQIKLKDLGELKYFLGEIARSSTGLAISQRQYTL